MLYAVNRNIFDVNVFGLIEMTKAVLPIMRSQHCGHIFNISSVAGLVAAAGVGIYNSTKYAGDGLSEAMCAEVKPYCYVNSIGINVTIIEPGLFRRNFLGSSLEVALALPAYNNTSVEQVRNYHHQSHNKQNGDPLRAAHFIIQLAA
jgi:short-subunit dehydrogenase